MLDVLFITDYVCPYCLVAKEALLQAMEETGIKASIRIQPMELTPVTREPVDTYSDPVRRSHYVVLVDPAKELGLDMKLPPHIVPRPYTKYAFEGRLFAAECGREEAYNDLMYKAYFIEEKNIGELDVLCELVERIGLDAAAYRAALESGKYEKEQMACNDYSRNELKPSGLPTIYMNGRKIDIKTYKKAEMVEFLRSFEPVADTGADIGADTGADVTRLVKLCEPDNQLVSLGGCGPDGCGFGEENPEAASADEFTGCGPDGC